MTARERHTIFTNINRKMALYEAAYNRARWQEFTPPTGTAWCPRPSWPAPQAERIKALVALTKELQAKKFLPL
jgi:hypothetical protein